MKKSLLLEQEVAKQDIKRIFEMAGDDLHQIVKEYNITSWRDLQLMSDSFRLGAELARDHAEDQAWVTKILNGLEF